MAVKNPFRATLIAPCGMDCAICMAFLQEKNRCGGGYAPDRKCSRNCTIFVCENVRAGTTMSVASSRATRSGNWTNITVQNTP